jgi:crotonobetainyl-CoA:carnitine CoA-transferase CaiB-like acyl-CoA transferase
MQRCERLGLPFAPIARPADLFDDPHLRASGGLVSVNLPNGQRLDLPALPVSFDDARPGLRRDVPAPGADNADILAELGYTEAEIAALADQKTIGGTR